MLYCTGEKSGIKPVLNNKIMSQGHLLSTWVSFRDKFTASQIDY